MKTSLTKNSRSASAFTMIEIAISIGVIGFALIAVIGILPRGMNAQKDNKEDTIISQDAPYFLNAIRNGEMRTNNNVLTSYVETIYVTNMSPNGTNVDTYSNPALLSGTNNMLTNDMNIIGLLSLPEFDYRNVGVANPPLQGFTNAVTAIVRAMSGSAIQQNGANTLTAFRYQLNVENAPWSFNTGYNPQLSIPNQPPQNLQTAGIYSSFLNNMLHEVRLKLSWPVYELPNGTIQKIGDSRQTYRSLIASHLYITNIGPIDKICFFQPQNYSTNTNSF